MGCRAATAGPTVDRREIGIATDEGTIGTFVVHPEPVESWPLVLFSMDAPGKRPLLHGMARRLAGHGYHVMLPNLYYRSTDAFELDFSSRASFDRMTELMKGVGNRMIGRDAAALIAHVDSDPTADAD